MRPRKRNNPTLPRNLYIQQKGKRVYFVYRHAKTGKSTSFGTDRDAVMLAARQLHEQLIPPQPVVDDLVARVIGSADSMGAWLDEFEKIVADRELADNSRRIIKSQVGIIREHFGRRKLKNITTKEVAGFIKDYAASGRKRQAQLLRSRLADIFDAAIEDGNITVNPVTPTRNPKAKVQRARLTLEQYRAILQQARAMPPYIVNGMQLGILTGQRLNDIAHMQFHDIRDGYLYVRQQKTDAMLRLSLNLRLDVPGISLGDVVAQCRDRLVSRHLLHHVRHWNGAKPGDPLNPETLSLRFGKARAAAGLSWRDSSKPPSFHELRSLAARLYDKQAGVEAQALLGHKDAATTARYTDSRGTEWITVG